MSRRPALHLALVGDVMLGRRVDRTVAGRDPLYPWGDLVDELRDADLTLGNLECCVSERGQPRDPGSPPPHLRAGPWAAAALAGAGFDFVALANDHALDFGALALEDTLRCLAAHGVARSGAGRDLAEACQPARFEARGWKVAVFSAADHPADLAATPTRPGTRLVEPRTDDPAAAELIADVARERESGYDLVVVSLHWGADTTRTPTPAHRAFARALIDAGAGLIHGHGAHLFHGVELYRDRPILYDTGDFVDDYAVDPVERNDLQFLFHCILDAGGVAGVELTPVRIAQARACRASPGERRWLLERMRWLGAPDGTVWEERAGRLVLARPAPPTT